MKKYLNLFIFLTCFTIVAALYATDKVSRKSSVYPDLRAVSQEFNNIYNNFFKIKFQEFSFDPANTITANYTCTEFQLKEDGIIIAIDIPNAPTSSTHYGTGDLCNANNNRIIYLRRSTGAQLILVHFYNETGADFNPPEAKWKVWYMPK